MKSTLGDIGETTGDIGFGAIVGGALFAGVGDFEDVDTVTGTDFTSRTVGGGDFGSCG